MTGMSAAQNRTSVITTVGLAMMVTLSDAQSACGACDADARQSLTIDGPGARDWFGWSVAAYGGTIAVGAPQRDGTGEDSGAVYVYRHDGRRWRPVQVLTPSDAEARDGFGIRIAIDGRPGGPAETMLIGSHIDGEGGGFAGAAYVFTFDGRAWTERHKLVAQQRDSFDQFGYSVAIQDDTAIIGAIGDDDAGRDAGAVYVFEQGGGEWTLAQKLTASDGADWERFGNDVSLDGDAAVIGAFRDENTGQFDPGLGAAYVFRRIDGQWSEEARLTAPRRELDDRFGWSVALDGGTAAVGAYFRDDVARDAGSVFLYDFADGRWTHATTLHRPGAAAGDGLGLEVVLSANVLLAGAPFAAVDGRPNVGLVTAFRRQFGTWVERGALAAVVAGSGDSLGAAAAWHRGTAIVGAYLADAEGMLDAGAAHVFDTSACVPVCTGDEAVRKARCRVRNGAGRLTVALRNGAPNDDYAITVGQMPVRTGTLSRRGRARVRFDGLPPGEGEANVQWGCGAETVKRFTCG